MIKPWLLAPPPAGRPVFVAEAQTQNVSGGTSLVINKPTGTVEGDLMIAFMWGPHASTAITWTGDTGWTELADQNAPTNLRVAWKLAGASEGASYTFTSSASLTLSGSILTYRPVNSVTPIAITGTLSQDTSATNGTTLTALGVTVPSNNSVLIAAFGVVLASVTLSTPTDMTSRSVNSDATVGSWHVFDQDVEAGASGDRVTTITGSGFTGSMILVALNPA